MSCVGETRRPPLAARAQPSRRPVISEALSRLSRSATSDGDTRKLVRLPVNDSSKRFTIALSTGAVASSMNTLRVALSAVVTKFAVTFGSSATPPARWSRACSLGPAYFPRSSHSVNAPLGALRARSRSAPAGHTVAGRFHGSTWM